MRHNVIISLIHTIFVCERIYVCIYINFHISHSIFSCLSINLAIYLSRFSLIVDAYLGRRHQGAQSVLAFESATSSSSRLDGYRIARIPAADRDS